MKEGEGIRQKKDTKGKEGLVQGQPRAFFLNNEKEE